MITRLTEMRNNVEMERAERRQRSHEDAMGIVHPPLPPSNRTAKRGPTRTGVFYDHAEEDRKHEARMAARRKADDELWEWYLAKRDPNAHCACGRFKAACMFSTTGHHRTRHIPLVKPTVKCKRCGDPVKDDTEPCGKCQVEESEVMNDLHQNR